MSPLYIPPTRVDSWQPSDQGFITWSFDPVTASGGSVVPVAGTVNIIRLKLRVDALVTNIHLSVFNPGSGLTSAQNFVALYRAGALVGVSASQQGAWQGTAGEKIAALVGGPFLVPAGDVIAAFYANGTTLPQFNRAGISTTPNNANLSAANSRFGLADTGRTTSMPDPLGAITAGTLGWWVGLS